MPRYDIQLHPTAEAELDALTTNPDALRETLREVAAEREPTSHPDAKHLEGQPGLFRVRAGKARAVCELAKPNLLVYRIGARDGVYDIIDDIEDRRVTA